MAIKSHFIIHVKVCKQITFQYLVLYFWLTSKQIYEKMLITTRSLSLWTIWWLLIVNFQNIQGNLKKNALITVRSLIEIHLLLTIFMCSKLGKILGCSVSFFTTSISCIAFPIYWPAALTASLKICLPACLKNPCQ